MSIFDKWDKNVDTEGLQKDIAEAEAMVVRVTIVKYLLVHMKLRLTRWKSRNVVQKNMRVNQCSQFSSESLKVTLKTVAYS